jgi:trimethylamine--corrinoid protein Co-methyltransferase
MVRRLWRGIRVDDETLGLDLTRAVGPAGDYLAERHTAKHCRSELWKSKYFQTITPEAWEEDGSKDLVDKIDQDLRRILETHKPEPLNDPTQKQVDAILERFGAI